MTPMISTAIVLTREEIIHLYSGGVLNLRIKGKEAEASIELSCSNTPPTRSTRIRFKTITTE